MRPLRLTSLQEDKGIATLNRWAEDVDKEFRLLRSEIQALRATLNSPTRVPVIPTASLPPGSAAMNGRVITEDAAVGTRNLIIYAYGQRFRISGGVAF